MSDKLHFADEVDIVYAQCASKEVSPEILDHIILQTETFLNNVEAADLVDEDQPVAFLPDGKQINIREIKEIFYKHAPNIIIQLAYRVKYLQGNE